MPIGLPEFVENPEPRCPVILLCDTSGSMHGEPINALNAGLAAFQKDVYKDEIASLRPFTPFFQPLEQYLRETENLKSDKYLEDFLNSDRLNSRTDDDKTLFLCLYDSSFESGK